MSCRALSPTRECNARRKPLNIFHGFFCIRLTTAGAFPGRVRLDKDWHPEYPDTIVRENSDLLSRCHVSGNHLLSATPAPSSCIFRTRRNQTISTIGLFYLTLVTTGLSRSGGLDKNTASYGMPLSPLRLYPITVSKGCRGYENSSIILSQIQNTWRLMAIGAVVWHLEGQMQEGCCGRKP